MTIPKPYYGIIIRHKFTSVYRLTGQGEGEGLTPFLPAEGGLAREGGGLFDTLADWVAAYTGEGGVEGGV